MNYTVKYENDNRVEILDNNNSLLYYILKESKNVLHHVVNYNNEPADIIIPREFPSGHKIDRIRRVSDIDMNEHNEFKKITISKGIEIEDCAFIYCKADEIVWPDDCPTIPWSCFFGSSIKTISNIDNVTKIKNEAFASSHIQEISWPSNCSIIPSECFKNSDLEKIGNIGNVELIGREAFAFSRLKDLDLSDANAIRFDVGSLLYLPDYCNFTPSYYVSKEELKDAYKHYLA